jgi:hypothetical protein
MMSPLLAAQVGPGLMCIRLMEKMNSNMLPFLAVQMGHNVAGPYMEPPDGGQGYKIRCLFWLYRWDTTRPGLTWSRLMENKNKELERLNGVYMKLLAGANVEYFEGRGRIVDAHTVEVNGQRYTVSSFLLSGCPCKALSA